MIEGIQNFVIGFAIGISPFVIGWTIYFLLKERES
jgi:hypothetical protein